MRNQRPKVSKEYFFRHPGSFPITMKWIATSYLVYGSPEAQSCQQGIWLEADSWWLGLWAWVSCPPGSWELLLPWLSCAPTPLGWNKSVYCHGKEWSSSVTVLVQSPSQVVPDSWQPHPAACRLFCPPLSPIVFSNSRPLSQWCRINLLSPAASFSFCLQSFLASWSFPMSQLFTPGGRSIGALASAISPSNEHSKLLSFKTDWFDRLAGQTDCFYHFIN